MKKILLLSGALMTGAAARAATLTLDWEAATQNADGSPISDLSGYRVFYATYSLLGMTTAQAMTAIPAGHRPAIAAPTTTCTVPDLSDATTYYFRLTAYDATGNQSGFNADGAGADVEVSTYTPSLAAPFQVSPLTLGAVNAAQAGGVVIRVRINGTPGTVQLAYSALDRAGLGSPIPMAFLGGGIWRGTIPGAVTGMGLGRLRYQVTVDGTPGQVQVLEVTQSVDAAPDGEGVASLPHSLGGAWGRTRADFGSLPAGERPKTVHIGQEDPMRVAGATREGTINRTANNGRPGMVYEFRADGKPASVFTRPVRLYLAYLDGNDDGVIDGTGIAASALKVYFHDGVEWRLAGGTVNARDHTVSVTTNHFSLYALFAASGGGSPDASEALAKESFLTPARLDGVGDVATFGPAAREVEIHDLLGNRVFKASGDGSSAIVWTARDDAGRLLESGAYIVKVTDADGKAHHQSIVVAK